MSEVRLASEARGTSEVCLVSKALMACLVSKGAFSGFQARSSLKPAIEERREKREERREKREERRENHGRYSLLFALCNELKICRFFHPPKRDPKWNKTPTNNRPHFVYFRDEVGRKNVFFHSFRRASLANLWQNSLHQAESRSSSSCSRSSLRLLQYLSLRLRSGPGPSHSPSIQITPPSCPRGVHVSSSPSPSLSLPQERSTAEQVFYTW